MQSPKLNRIGSVLIDLKNPCLNITSSSKLTWRFLEAALDKLGGDSEHVCWIFASPIDEIEPTIICQSQVFAVWKRFMREIEDVLDTCMIEFRSKQTQINDFRALVIAETSPTSIIQEEERETKRNDLEILERELEHLREKKGELHDYFEKMERVCVSFEYVIDYSVYTQSHIF